VFLSIETRAVSLIVLIKLTAITTRSTGTKIHLLIPICKWGKLIRWYLPICSIESVWKYRLDRTIVLEPKVQTQEV
jgi:hypothetical protein